MAFEVTSENPGPRVPPSHLPPPPQQCALCAHITMNGIQAIAVLNSRKGKKALFSLRDDFSLKQLSFTLLCDEFISANATRTISVPQKMEGADKLHARKAQWMGGWRVVYTSFFKSSFTLTTNYRLLTETVIKKELPLKFLVRSNFYT